MLTLIYERNLYVGVGLLIFASDGVLSSSLDFLAARRVELLRIVPEAWFFIRFRHGHQGPYLKDDVFPFLPDSIRAKLQNLSQFLERNAETVARIRETKATETDPAKQRKSLVDLIYGLAQQAEPDQVDMILQNFEQEGLLSPADRELIRTVAGRD